MPDRYFTSPPGDASQAILEGEQAHHLLNVMRAKPGMEVTLFDGSGWEYAATIESVGKRNVHLLITGREQVSRELARQITIAVALPKGDRQRFLVEKLVELGCHSLRPLLAARSVVQANAKSLERLRRQVVEASKQSGRNRLMAIEDAVTVKQLLEDRALPPLRFIADPRSSGSLANSAGDAVIAIGPEGGWTETELGWFAEAGWQAIGLGPTVLRIETAALAAMTCLGQV